MFSLFKRLVIAVETIAANSMSKSEYLEFHKELIENQKIKSIEVLNIQLKHSQKELLFRAEYKQAKGIELTADEQMALERMEREKNEYAIIDIEQSHILLRAFNKKANGVCLTDVEAMVIQSYEEQKQIKQNI